MRARHYVAAGAALVVSAGALVALPTAAQAAPIGNILYVNSSTTCSDSTTDSTMTPYCTIQAAADAVEPGQTVKIGVGDYNGGVTITHSGTASAPIKFVGDGSAFENYPSEAVFIGDANTLTSGYALDLSGVSNVEVSNISVRGESTGAVYVTGSSNVELDHDYVVPYGTPGIETAGGSTAVTAVDDEVFEAKGAGFQVDSGVSGTVISNDISNGSTDGVDVNGASGTTVTGDTLVGLTGRGVSVSGGATGTAVENTIVYSVSSIATGVNVDAASASGTTADYDIVYTPKSSAPYSWAGTTYASASALSAAVGQGAYDLNVNPNISATFAPNEGSPAINSGDSAAPGEPATDFYGHSRALDPHDAMTGTGGGYYARGAVQVLDPIAVNLTESNAWAAGSVTETFTTALTTAPWSSAVTYTYDFGDGTTQSTSAATITHTYSTVGQYTVKLTAIDADHGSATTSASFQLAGGNAYYPISPTRVLDTRHAIGVPTARVPANGTVTLKLAGVGGVPAAGAVAVVLNVTVVNPSANGVITLYPDGTTAPTASNLNFLHGENRPNLVTVKLGTDGSVKLRNGGNGTADLVADLEGYYAPGTGAGFVGVQNFRPGPISLTVGKPQTVASVSMSADNWLNTGAAAVVINVTVTKGTANGYVSAYPDGGTVPTASNLNYNTNENIANMVIVPLGKDGYFDLIAGGKAGATVTAIVDVEGFYTNQPNTGGTGFIPTQPTRLIDTRSGLGGTKGPTDAVQVDPTKLAGIPAHAAGIAANVTVVAPYFSGYLSAYTGGWNGTSTLNFSKGQNVANLAQLAWTPDATSQTLNLDTNGVGADMVLDMFGYFVD